MQDPQIFFLVSAIYLMATCDLQEISMFSLLLTNLWNHIILKIRGLYSTRIGYQLYSQRNKMVTFSGSGHLKNRSIQPPFPYESFKELELQVQFSFIEPPVTEEKFLLSSRFGG